MQPDALERGITSGNPENMRAGATGRVFIDQVLKPWQATLPPQPHRILDLCTGPGLDAIAIRSLGWTPVAVDISASVLGAAAVDEKALANAVQLPFGPDQFAGALVKDAWVYLSPEEKAKVMEGLSRTLVPGGSAMIASQRSDALRIRSIPAGSQYPICETSITEYDWQQRVEHEQSQGQVFSVEFVSLPDPTIELAQRHGLTPTAVINYSSESLLAADNRWLPASGFVITLQK